MATTSACLTENQLTKISVALAIKIWECWHGPMAKLPASHNECVDSLLLMLQEYNEATHFVEKYYIK